MDCGNEESATRINGLALQDRCGGIQHLAEDHLPQSVLSDTSPIT